MPEEEVEESRDSFEMRRLEWQEKEKEQEVQLRMKELEIKECEISIQLKVNELELATAAAKPTNTTEKFDVTRYIRFIAPFQETEPDKYFSHF